tara:strand:+ start:373 stop:1287 length:915 start_codon:yes stop_codon:yes gene_type:complete
MYSKIAFCFLVYKELPLLNVWKRYFKNVDDKLYNIYVHYKEKPTNLNGLKNINILDSTVETNWGEISLVIAQNLLLKNAMKDPKNSHFIFLSDSCIPVKSFNHIKHALDENLSKSFFAMCPDSQCFPRCDKLVNSIIDIDLENLQYGHNPLPRLERKYIKKSSQWCILIRKHVKLLLKSTDYIHWFQHCTASDEHCYITKLHQLKLKNEINTDIKPTLIDWDDENDTPYTYRSTDDLFPKHLRHVITSTSHFFMRKFDTQYEFKDEYYDLISSKKSFGGFKKKTKKTFKKKVLKKPNTYNLHKK